MKEKEKCQFCTGNPGDRKINADMRVNGELIIFEYVPAKVCDQCGEKYFSANVYAELEKMVKKKQAIKKELPVPVMCFPLREILI